ncbi:multiprotein-bridging factor 1 family protein [Nocardiopsis sp. NPDC006938]|uniref:helix-turn-helix domain-containing protein n=1 Tax=Nocardiopsis sp. NPDC006938 TaxID=3364337 RepID=UPI0036AB8D03
MARPNTALKAARMSRLMSQDDLARALREAGVDGASKRLVQRWEAGSVVSPRPVYARALEGVLGVPIESLGFALTALGAGAVGHDRGQDKDMASPHGSPNESAQVDKHGNYSGIWLSRYDYVSNGRGSTYTGKHYVVLFQHADRLTIHSVPGSSDSPLTMDLTIDGAVCTGTWTEQTAEEGYYRGARYHGAIQLLIEPTGRRMSGKWVGFGKDFDVNTGPWELVFQDASTTKATVDQYQRPPS